MGIAPDFSVFYLAAKTLVEGNNPYTAQGLFTGVGYPVFSLIPFIPFTLLPYQISQALFTFLSITSILICVLLSLKIINWRLKPFHILILFTLTLFMFPVRFTLGMGQSNNIVLLFLLSGLYLYQKKKINYSSLFFGLSVVLKPITIFLFLYFLVKKQFRLIINSLVIVFIFLLITLSSYYIYYFNNVLPPLLNLSGREIYYNQGMMGFISRLTNDNKLRLYLNYFISFAIFVPVVYRLRKIKDAGIGFSLFLVSLVLIDTLSWQHHFVFLIFPYIVLLKKIFEIRSKYYLFLLVLSYILVAGNIKNPQLFSSPLILSHVFIGTILLFIVIIHIILICLPKKRMSKDQEKGPAKEELIKQIFL
ncbi:DUF2029 domain-containing protein [Candidatus Gottesmanbacteria bacterium]|nr:DUF2029 domain-containing protein [Candidatus Gottesmanbacteria bacterium]